jgi:integrase
MLGLAWEDVDLDTGSSRWPGSSSALEATEDRITVVGPDWLGNRPIFTSGLGTAMEPRNFNRRWDTRIEIAGVPRITVHGARRTCGSLLVDLDVHPRAATQILRHANLNIAMEIYSQPSSAATRDALKRLGEALN